MNNVAFNKCVSHVGTQPSLHGASQYFKELMCLDLNLNLNGLLVTRQIDNTSPGGGGGVRQEGN